MKLVKITLPAVLLGVAQIAAADGGFKRFSVSAGWMHVMPQGKANPFNINTAVANGTRAEVGTISPEGFLKAIDPNAIYNEGSNSANLKDTLTDLVNGALWED